MSGSRRVGTASCGQLGPGATSKNSNNTNVYLIRGDIFNNCVS